ncbi:hypothetical protein G6O69_38165 [Pseudenhygromyxa sp. WMMC2535]|uniref:hypothetical protein n=1 Tax=Pseudenhygromyxa sp. WMMC2535 TaxID=2712867 RepID=UPI001554900A|nr:hypothetical protein [Pseudenhygromyxa sp. WMMC2535]NVB41383.1 hypothetical protein [Pseudenhygromyxa sp. WMMC2535]NVB43693.1 hypothetical protein [Pseudenhygromyxa sp. WMMC2535]
MNKLLSKLPAFALPFVTRSLRGGRARRYTVLSLVLACLTMIFGLWIALGDGDFERDIRVEMGLESPTYDREHQEFVLFANSEIEYRALQTATQQLSDRVDPSDDPRAIDYYREQALQLKSEGNAVLYMFANAEVHTPEQAAKREEVQALLASSPGTSYLEVPDPARYVPHDRVWTDPTRRALLDTILAKGGVPSVEYYRSPLGLREAMLLAGALAGLLLLAMGTVFAPILVAMQQAQERSENTLAPLLGTALSPREIALGLAAGPLCVVGIFAAPQVLLYVLGAVIAGFPLFALATLAALAATMATLVFGTQLLGQLLGRRRSPGIIALGLMILALITWSLGVSLAVETGRETRTLAALLPHIGLTGLFGATWVELSSYATAMFSAAFANAVGCGVVGWLLLTALSRKLEDREGPLLRAGEALAGALTFIALTSVALSPLANGGTGEIQYAGLAILALPLAILLMLRVPSGEGPAQLRVIHLSRLLAEFSAWFAAYILIANVINGFDVHAFHPVALAWLAWTVLVLGLMAVRSVALPVTIASGLWVSFCGLGVLVGYAHALAWTFEHNARNSSIFVFFEVSPVLGLLQVAFTLWFPISLVLALRKGLASVKGALPAKDEA